MSTPTTQRQEAQALERIGQSHTHDWDGYVATVKREAQNGNLPERYQHIASTVEKAWNDLDPQARNVMNELPGESPTCLFKTLGNVSFVAEKGQESSTDPTPHITKFYTQVIQGMSSVSSKS